jgi:hypothetical protein
MKTGKKVQFTPEVNQPIHEQQEAPQEKITQLGR